MTNKTPKMTRQHFEWIAETIRDLYITAITDHDIDNVARWFTQRLKSTNPNFNPDRFLEACKPKNLRG